MCTSLLGINLLTMLFFSNMIIIIIIIIILILITSGGEVARVALNVYTTNMQLTGVLSPVEFISTSTLAAERPVLAGRILPSFYVGNSVLLAQ